MMKKKTFIIISSSILLIVISIFLLYLHSPQYSISEIKKSILTKNKLKFEYYVDIDAISCDIVTALISQDYDTEFEKGKPTLCSTLTSSIIKSIEAKNWETIYNNTNIYEKEINIAFVLKYFLDINPTNYKNSKRKKYCISRSGILQ